MDVIVSGHHTDVPDRFRAHVEAKLSKLTQLNSRVQRVDVEVIRESNPRLSEVAERVEITVRGKGPVLRAEAGAPDRYAALDLAISKLLERARRAQDRHKSRHRGAGRAVVHADAGPGDAIEEPKAVHVVPDRVQNPSDTIEIPLGDSPVTIREKVHIAKPMSVEEAIDEMELVGHPFFLFIDSTSHLPSVLYHRRGWTYGVIRLKTAPEE